MRNVATFGSSSVGHSADPHISSSFGQGGNNMTPTSAPLPCLEASTMKDLTIQSHLSIHKVTKIGPSSSFQVLGLSGGKSDILKDRCLNSSMRLKNGERNIKWQGLGISDDLVAINATKEGIWVSDADALYKTKGQVPKISSTMSAKRKRIGVWIVGTETTPFSMWILPLVHDDNRGATMTFTWGIQATTSIVHSSQ